MFFILAVALLATGATRASATCRPAPRSNLGCEFYAVPLPNAFIDTATYSFSVHALNPSVSATATLQVSGGGLVTPASHPLAALTAGNFALPWISTLVNATGTALISGGAYHLTSDLPLSIVQFNAEAAASQSNDATLLLPVRSGATAFLANVWPEWSADAFTHLPAQIGIVATAAATTVQISGHDLQPGAGIGTTGGSVQMDAGDVLLLSSALTASVDISGTRIDASAPVLVFSSHAGTYVPSDVGYADHMEDAEAPISDLGSDFLLVRPSDPSGGNNAKQMIKVIGTEDNTQLTYDPVVGGAPASIGAGAAFTFEATSDVHLQADHPIGVMQVMESASAFPGNPDAHGDPAQLASIPSNRGALVADFIAPLALAPMFAQVIAPTGAQVLVDGVAVAGWSPIGSSGYSGANVALCCTDAHHATGDQPFTVSVYAYPAAAATSVWYAGQLGPRDDIFGDGFD
jgi:hypothetical protein